MYTLPVLPLRQIHTGLIYRWNASNGYCLCCPVSTWEKPDGFVSPSNESSQEKSHSEESPERDLKGTVSETGKCDSHDAELQVPKRNAQVSHPLPPLNLYYCNAIQNGTSCQSVFLMSIEERERGVCMKKFYDLKRQMMHWLDNWSVQISSHIEVCWMTMSQSVSLR